MFTGIIEHVGAVRACRPGPSAVRLEVDLGPLAEGSALGDSIAVDGVCLTLAALSGSLGAFDAVPETVGCTTLANLRAGDRVNLERALRADGRLGGHVVQGHVDAVGRIRRAGPAGNQWVLSVAPPPEVAELIVEKGSIALAGVSLTVAALAADGTFTCAIIPTTLQMTNLSDRRPGDPINVETDILARTVRRLLNGGPVPQATPLTVEKLREHGFA
jgi:riboflavin synthase